MLLGYGNSRVNEPEDADSRPCRFPCLMTQPAPSIKTNKQTSKKSPLCFFLSVKNKKTVPHLDFSVIFFLKSKTCPPVVQRAGDIVMILRCWLNVYMYNFPKLPLRVERVVNHGGDNVCDPTHITRYCTVRFFTELVVNWLRSLPEIYIFSHHWLD